MFLRAMSGIESARIVLLGLEAAKGNFIVTTITSGGRASGSMGRLALAIAIPVEAVEQAVDDRCKDDPRDDEEDEP